MFAPVGVRGESGVGFAPSMTPETSRKCGEFPSRRGGLAHLDVRGRFPTPVFGAGRTAEHVQPKRSLPCSLN